MFMSWPNRPGANGMTSRLMIVAMKTTTGREREDEPIGAGRAEVLLRQHLEPVDDRQERPERPDPVRPDPEVHQGDDLHLHVDDQEGGRDAHQQDGRRRDHEPDEPDVRRRGSRGSRSPKRTTTSDAARVPSSAAGSGASVKMILPGEGVSAAPGSARAAVASLVHAAHDRVEGGHDRHRVGDQVAGRQQADRLEVDERRVVDPHPERLVGAVADRRRRRTGRAGPRPRRRPARAAGGGAAAAWP